MRFRSATANTPLCGRSRPPDGGRHRGLLRTCAGRSITDASIDIVLVKLRFAERVNLEVETDTSVAPFILAGRWLRWRPSRCSLPPANALQDGFPSAASVRRLAPLPS